MQTDAAALVDDALKVAVQKRSGKGIGEKKGSKCPILGIYRSEKRP
jgi:hypothetical protein